MKNLLAVVCPVSVAVEIKPSVQMPACRCCYVDACCCFEYQRSCEHHTVLIIVAVKDVVTGSIYIWLTICFCIYILSEMRIINHNCMSGSVALNESGIAVGGITVIN